MFRTVCSAFQNLRLGVIKLLQMIIASKKNPTHHMLLLSFVSSCKVVTKVHSIPENLTYRITCCYYLLLASCKVVTKDHSMPENLTHRITCCYYLLYHLAKFIPPKRRFGKEEQKMKSWFWKHFARAWVLDLGDEPLKSRSKIRISSFVPPSQIFVWGASS